MIFCEFHFKKKSFEKKNKQNEKLLMTTWKSCLMDIKKRKEIVWLYGMLCSHKYLPEHHTYYHIICFEWLCSLYFNLSLCFFFANIKPKQLRLDNFSVIGRLLHSFYMVCVFFFSSNNYIVNVFVPYFTDSLCDFIHLCCHAFLSLE